MSEYKRARGGGDEYEKDLRVCDLCGVCRPASFLMVEKTIDEKKKSGKINTVITLVEKCKHGCLTKNGRLLVKVR